MLSKANLTLHSRMSGSRSVITDLERKFLKALEMVWTSPAAQRVKNLPEMQETPEMWVRSLGREDSLEEETAVHSSILAWKIPWTEEPSKLQSKVLQRVEYDWVIKYLSPQEMVLKWSFKKYVNTLCVFI